MLQMTVTPPLLRDFCTFATPCTIFDTRNISVKTSTFFRVLHGCRLSLPIAVQISQILSFILCQEAQHQMGADRSGR